MHAVVVRVNIDDSEAATARLREEVVPRVSQAREHRGSRGRSERVSPAR
jgi:hypothetical protein